MFDFACASGRGSRLYLADYFRYILSAIYYPSGLFSVFRQSEENFRSLSKFGHGTEEIYFGTCLHLGNSLNRFLQLDLYDNYTFYRFLMLGGGWGTGGYQFQFSRATEFSRQFQLLARRIKSSTLRCKVYFLLFHIHRARVYESIWNLFNGNEMDHISKIFSKRSFTDCNFLLIYWKSIHSIQYLTLAVALYRPNFFRRSLWDGKLVKMFLLLCKCIFNFFLQLIFKSSMTFLDSYGYKFYAVFFCSLSFSSTFPGVWTYVEVEWVR